MNPVLRCSSENGISDLKASSDSTLGVSFDLRRGAHGPLHQLVKRAAAQDVRESKYSREQVAERLSWLLSRNITLAQIDAITAESKDHRMPAEWVPAWIEATGSRRILALLCEASGAWLGDETDRDLAELGRATLKAKQAASRITELEGRLWDKAR